MAWAVQAKTCIHGRSSRSPLMGGRACAVYRLHRVISTWPFPAPYLVHLIWGLGPPILLLCRFSRVLTAGQPFLSLNTQHGSLWPSAANSELFPRGLSYPLAPHGSPAVSDYLHQGKQDVLPQTKHLGSVLPASELCTRLPQVSPRQCCR